MGSARQDAERRVGWKTPAEGEQVARLLRWGPFIFIFLGLALLAEVSVLSDMFYSHFGPVAWDRLHWHGSAVLVIAAYLAQSHKQPPWRRLLLAVTLVLVAGFAREVRQYYGVGAHGFSRHDIHSNLQGSLAGAALCLLGRTAIRRAKTVKPM